MPTLTLRILGCGSSGGVPRVGYGWGACDPAEPKNRRRRCSLLVERREAGDEATTVLVDTSPDLREQLLDAAVARLDGILFTHSHADHTHGIDDVRPLVIHMRRRIPVHADATTSDLLRARFAYCFTSREGSLYPPILDLHALEAGAPVTVEGPGGPVTATAFVMEHGPEEKALGFRFADAAYAPDVSTMLDAAKARLRNLDLLIVDALRDSPHPTHFSVSDALALIEEVAPRRAVLTNLHTDLDYETLRRRLPPGVVPAYDGLSLAVDG
ncbi:MULTISPECIES: MBL fold metallo-hydrolase [Methylobacterium]|jgi:phosphoribosyl 1,2-cyclic phosphate phosphodiesterase|uniref:MBL fold metallo-hydrolase n=1 Tax=Methylobacterium TaxID=407 RepID=UPI0008DF576D|nr:MULTISPECIES: MBL fold metallo-hydrolase [Methylobacterium]MBZ6416561.1 MBL fold metallo-hydrolase [Methylobacterium sp.]MBK3397599.1 MBL fold metallo-hydrolase [Methylobacterium ajmalii]MBK3411630.1 MBL fold metallo-hydrolase [Methylobacterium ajmalii]MBK3426663.1 MBL fold metallo-hydrolase [Methylobacterium ajmalii]SFF49226.1 phosphoribosyl 1,2-cyclic phosphate phosphodiesterase [Methylobacterium sp. yr596]